MAVAVTRRGAAAARAVARSVTAACVLAAVPLAACGAGGAHPGASGAAGAPVPVPAARGDSAGVLVPAGYGTLRQDDISVRVRLPALLVRATPLDESIIRLLSPDSYHALRDLREGSRDAIARAAARLGVQRPSLWYISFYGLEPDARYTARDVKIVSGGREFRPLDLVPLSAGFGAERVDQRGVQSAIYLFDEGIDPNQPLSLSVESVPGSSWSAVLPMIERERALVRARARAR